MRSCFFLFIKYTRKICAIEKGPKKSNKALSDQIDVRKNSQGKEGYFHKLILVTVVIIF